MRLKRIGNVFLFLSIGLLVTAGMAGAAPQMAIALVEGRNYDQTHDTGYIDWSGSVGYVYMTHRDSTSLPPEEGGTSCGSGCQEWVTRIGSGGTVSGSFERDVSFFEVMVGFTHDSNVGSATVRACTSASTSNLFLGPGGGLPGFVSLYLTVPAGCSNWSLSASGGYVDFRSVDVNYVIVPPTATFTPSQTPTTTFTSTPTATLTLTSTITNTPTLTFTPTFTPTNTATSTFTFTPTFTPTNTATSTYTYTPTFTQTNTSTLTVTPSITMTLPSTPTWTATSTPTFTSTATTAPSQIPTKTARLIHQRPKVSIPDRWWIWETGELKVSCGDELLAGVKVTIRDPLNRWLPMITEYDPDEIPDAIEWDRRFANGTLAPSGEYPIVVRVCDVRGSCGQDRGVIVIPVAETRTATMTTSPTTTITLMPSATSVPTNASPTQTPILPAVTPENISAPVRLLIPLWQILGLLGLFVVIASASLVDPRPKALNQLGDIISLLYSQAGEDTFENKQNKF